MNLLSDFIEKKDIDGLKTFMQEYDLIIEDNKIVPRNQEAKTKISSQETYWNLQQQLKKILLNSCYGVLLNEKFRLYDKRLGETTTLTGRMLVRFMSAKINEIVTGDFDHQGRTVAYNDTDSLYFSAYEVLKDDPLYADFKWTRDNVIALYDSITEEFNSSLPQFVHETFNTSLEKGAIIKAGRELIGLNSLFIKKKRYSILMYEKEGVRFDLDQNGNEIPLDGFRTLKSRKFLKSMGGELRRSDTSKEVQGFLETILIDVLTEKNQNEIFDYIRKFREEFRLKSGWEMGSPKRVNNLSKFASELSAVNNINLTNTRRGKVNMPQHVLASLNWNKMLKINNDRYSTPIEDGGKIVVCMLKTPNIYSMSAIAYPIDQVTLPDWFKGLPFDHAGMETVIIDKKLENLIGVLDWDLDQTKNRDSDEFFVF